MRVPEPASRLVRATLVFVAFATSSVFGIRNVHAEPLRLRADAFVQTKAPAPVGLLVLRGEDRRLPWVDAETVTWLGITDSPSPTGDVLTLSVRLRDPRSGTEARAGRMLVSMGAVRPLHLDGARGTVRVSGGTSVEAFAGVPVVRRFDYRTFDVAAGGRLAQAIGDRAIVGLSYEQRRSNARPADEEAGADLALTPAPWLTAAGRTAFDLVNRGGPTDALGSVSVQNASKRLELFTTHRSPGRLLPSTSLFSVLGDFAATAVGSTGRWRMFPRLDVIATGSAQFQGGTTGGQGIARAVLALDDAWAGSITVELRRVELGDTRWSGARAALGVPLRRTWRLATELELVRPDHPRGRGDYWPWALVGLGHAPAPGWDVAAGVEAASTPTAVRELHALARVSWSYEATRP